MRAFKVVLELMENADKDSVRLAAALAVLKAAGVKFDGEVTLTVSQPPQVNPAQTVPIGKLLTLKSTSTTLPLQPNSGEGES